MLPEFFADRNLGRVTITRLRERGWTIYRLADIYPDDAQGIPDDEWIRHGCRQGWVLLTKDRRIRYRASELAALDSDAFLFCLANQQLTTTQMVDAFISAESRITSAVSRGEAGFWHVYGDGSIRRVWP